MNKEDSKQESPENKPPWLVRIQENSWEAEIILSGLVLFTLIKAPDILYNIRIFLSERVFDFRDMWYFEAAMAATVQFLTFGFLIHLIMRGIWVGYVGFSYAFPEGIKSTGLGFQKRYMPKKDGEWLTPRILLMERYCSMIFATAWMFFLFVAGIAFAWFLYNWFISTILFWL